jgi:site-specific DNA-adenine methylase
MKPMTREGLDLSSYPGRPISFSYPGAKSSMAKELIALMPRKGGTYIEPFAGRANVALNVMLWGLKFERFHLNDIATAPFLRCLRDYGDSVLVSHDPRKAYYKHWGERSLGLLTPEGVLNEPRNCYGCGTYGDSGPAGNARSAEGYRRDLRRGCELMRKNRILVTSKDWRLLRMETLSDDAFAYFDPPYFGSDVRSYTSSGFDYKTLVKLLERAHFRWLLSEYEQPFYNKAFGKPVYRKRTMCQVSHDGSERVECVYANYDIEEIL